MRIKNRIVTVFLVSSLLILGSFGILRAATVSFDPPNAAIGTGETVSVNIVAYEVTGLEGFQLDISFNANVINIENPATINSVFIFPAANSIDNTSGTGSISAASFFNPQNGNVILATLKITGVANGMSHLDLSNVILGARGGLEIPSQPLNGSVTVGQGDNDRDGFSQPEDCNDDDASIHPGAAELCDLVDNDCNNVVDEGYDVGVICSEGVGACTSVGQTVCSSDKGSTVCSAVAGQATVETCDGLDNNCDGRTDEELLNACGACGAVPVEVCDGIDNDCDGSVDEDYADLGSACSAGIGACTASGTMVCNPAGDGTVCSAVAGTPTAEVCDGTDNNCNGSVDDGIADIVSGTDIGACQSQIERCTGGSFQVVQASIGPATEACDDVDNDCDGSTDEDLTQATTCGVGACSGNTGIETCAAGQWGNNTCDPLAGAVVEVCDAGQADENCNGSVNEGCACVDGETSACGSDTGACQAGVQTCETGQWGACAGEVGPVVETCDGLDNNCDGQTDEELLNACGACGAVPAEVCDGIDNDCDGSVDEDYADLGSACSAGVGACTASGTMVCNPAGDGTVCTAVAGQATAEVCNGVDEDCDGTPDDGIADVVSGTDIGACQSQIERCEGGLFQVIQVSIGPAAEVCDDVDNDCDGSTDEDLTQATTCGVGACSGNTGIETCAAGQWGNNTCDPLAGAVVEVCDVGQADENCNGSVNEGCACVDGETSACGSDTGACQAGVQTCETGQWGACAGEVGPAAETCDGVDNNCDGQTDEGVLNACGACGAVPAEVCDGIDNDCDGSVDEDIILDDGNACTTEECIGGQEVHTSIDTSDGDACTIDSCDPLTGDIINEPLNVDDNSPCTIDACDSSSGAITHIQDPTLPDLDRDAIPDLCDGDIDGDQIPNVADNCQTTPNNDQTNTDGDGFGDACDDDDDNDGVTDSVDNCPKTVNPGQDDMDGDGTGDVCDTDQDGDGWLNDADNCPDMPNADQLNTDNDGLGNVCDADDDNDGWEDAVDNCSTIPNPNQEDADGDHIGDVCDPDDDNDGIGDVADNCLLVVNPDQADSDGDGEGDVCDEDLDGDGVPNTSDNCPDVMNQDQKDTDGDHVGDVCDPDDDNDGIEDVADNCPLVPNPSQQDMDGDRVGDACDNDLDGDGVANADDNCPLKSNSNQLDSDSDGKGNACDPKGDLNNDGKVDMADHYIFRSTLGKCEGNPAYIAEADYDKNGCVTLRDYAIWFGYYGYYWKNK